MNAPREIRKPDIGPRPKPPALPPQRSSRRRRKAPPLSIQPLGALKQVPGKAMKVALSARIPANEETVRAPLAGMRS